MKDIEVILKALSLEYKKEYKFCPDRKFRADFYVPQLNLLIEYEGGVWIKGRHTTALGYTRDCEKYNLASIMGYRLLRYTKANVNQLARDIIVMQT